MPVEFKQGDFVSVRGKVASVAPDSDGDVLVMFRNRGCDEYTHSEYINAADVLDVLPPAVAVGDKVVVVHDLGDGEGEVVAVDHGKVWVWFPDLSQHCDYDPDELKAA